MDAWTWGPPDAVNRVTGDALDFCLVVTQRRNVADTGLTVTGDVAAAWIAIAQAFAGRPTDPRPPAGTRPPAGPGSPAEARTSAGPGSPAEARTSAGPGSPAEARTSADPGSPAEARSAL
jgi:hypothetical protein